MKFSTVMAVVAVSLAIFATGCRYNKAGAAGAGAGDNATASDIATEDLEGAGLAANSANLAAQQEGSLAGMSERRFEDYCTPCTDVNFAPVYFGFDATTIQPGELGKVDVVAQHLAANADRVVVIEGNCDERGSNEYNMSLGESRAAVVSTYLTRNGIAADRIQTRSYGEEKPAVVGADEFSWSQNRRAEFVIFSK